MQYLWLNNGWLVTLVNSISDLAPIFRRNIHASKLCKKIWQCATHWKCWLSGARSKPFVACVLIGVTQLLINQRYWPYRFWLPSHGVHDPAGHAAYLNPQVKKEYQMEFNCLKAVLTGIALSLASLAHGGLIDNGSTTLDVNVRFFYISHTYLLHKISLLS